MDGLGVEALAVLALAAFIAGLVDAIAGGGGLITVPALALAGLDPAAAVATNKVNASFGTFSATLSFTKAGHINLGTMWPMALASGLGAVAGALALAYTPNEWAALALPFILIAVAAYFAFSPKMSDADAHQRLGKAAFAGSVIPAIGFYDGVFGPGAGSFFMLGFIGLLGYGLVKATAHTKLVNFASNFASLVTFAFGGLIVWKIGLMMGVSQFAGSSLGAHLALRNGARLIRPLLVVIAAAMAIKLASAPGHPLSAFVKSLAAGFFGF